MEPLYIAGAATVYACIATILILALVFGWRARRNVKKERITSLQKGFSPLDIQRIFIGKTYPRRLTRALIVHWAQMGYIRVEYVNRTHVKLVKLRNPSAHDKETAAFFDRGVYVRERDIFTGCVFKRNATETIVNINSPLIKRSEVRKINSGYAVREDDGVYSPLHYKLKVLTFALSIAPFILVGIVYSATAKAPDGMIYPLMMLLGMYVFVFVHEIPFLFRLVWSAGWVAPAVGIMAYGYAQNMQDPLLMCYAAIFILFAGIFVLVRFVDYREKNNLSDYSDLVNYRKYLLFSSATELAGEDYYAALPYLYAFNIKSIAKRKFNAGGLPSWYSCEHGERSGLL